MNGCATPVIHPVANRRPAIIESRLHTIKFVTALRTVFVQPKFTRVRMDHQSLWISVPITPNLGQSAILADERIVIWYPTVVKEAHSHSVVIRQVLCRVSHQVSGGAGHALAYRDEQITVRMPSEPPTIVPTSLRLRLEHILDIDKSIACDNIQAKVVEGPNTLEEYDQQAQTA